LGGRLPFLAVAPTGLLLLLWVQIQLLLLLSELLLDKFLVEGEDIHVLVELGWLLIHLHSEPGGGTLLGASEGRIFLLPTAVLLIDLRQAMELVLVGDIFLVDDVILLEELLEIDDSSDTVFGFLVGDEL